MGKLYNLIFFVRTWRVRRAYRRHVEQMKRFG